LRTRVAGLTWEFNPTTTPLRRTAIVDSIDWRVRGVGASQPAAENVRRKKTPANMTEDDRKLNRRVEIILEPGNDAVPDPGSDDAARVIEDVIRGRRIVPIPPHPPQTKVPWTLPKRQQRQTFLDAVKALSETLGFLDVETILGTITDNIPPGDPDWTDDFRKEMQKLDDERRQRQDAPPRRGVDPLL
jgi:hypothetical protein